MQLEGDTQVVLVDSASKWWNGILTMIKQVTINVISEVGKDDVKFAFAESLVLASSLGTEAKEAMMKFIREQADKVAAKYGLTND
ncbi:MAG: hypothetical protein WCP87_06025, partial [Atribacterota bacterium]